MKKLLIICCLFIFLFWGCDSQIEDKGKPITLSEKESLTFLVKNSDIIALVYLSGGTNKPKPPLFFGTPKSVKANIETMLKGEEKSKFIKLIASPKYLGPNVIKSTITLRNGYHLIFACSSEDVFQPTTSHSVYDIAFGKIFPIWRPDQYKEMGPNGEKVSSGIPLDEVLNEIKNEIKNS